MGFITAILPKKIDFSSEEVFHIYSTGLYNFLAGPIGTYLEKSEFRQIEKILDIDLSILVGCPQNCMPDDDNERYQLYLAEENNDAEKVKQLKLLINEKEKQWKKNFNLNNEGWIEIKELLNVIENYHLRVQREPKYYKNIMFNLDWEYYFVPTSAFLSNPTAPKNIIKLQYWKKLDMDFMELYFYANILKKKGYNYMRLSGSHTGDM